uniref:Uncharacterized protein n=1 Tax=Cairina moschata TaxID=8855 RepID=A0A8C3BL42_CAIMO
TMENFRQSCSSMFSQLAKSSVFLGYKLTVYFRNLTSQLITDLQEKVIALLEENQTFRKWKETKVEGLKFLWEGNRDMITMEKKVFQDQVSSIQEKLEEIYEQMKAAEELIKALEERNKAGQEAVKAFLKQNQDIQGKNKVMYEKNKALQEKNKVFWKDHKAFWNKDMIFWDEEMAISSSELTLWEEYIAAVYSYSKSQLLDEVGNALSGFSYTSLFLLCKKQH